MITLIANSGIQFYSKKITLNLKEKVIPAQYYWQRKFEEQDLLTESKKYQLDLGYEIEDDFIAPKMLLEFDEEGNLDKEKTGLELISEIPEEELIIVHKIKDCIEQYKSFWIPIPFFKLNPKNNKTLFGPTGWSRMMLNEIEYFKDKEGNANISFRVNIVFDTSLSNSDNSNMTLDAEDTSEENNYFKLSGDTDKNLQFLSSEPSESSNSESNSDNSNMTLDAEDTSEENNYFKLSGDTDKNLQFLSSEPSESSNSESNWIDEYLLLMVHDSELPNNDKPLKYIAQYLYLVQYLANLKEENEIEKVLLFPNNISEAVDVDLVLDIGNARTCGLLFESTPNETSYNFNSVRKLELANLTTPGIIYTEPFSMRLAFFKASFGDISVPRYPNLFAWPSVLRIGDEAVQLLNNYDIPSQILTEPANTLSSPKRYLWDTKISDKPWEFIPSKKNDSGYYEKKHVSIGYLSTQFTRDGKLVDNTDGLKGRKKDEEIDTGHGVEPKWSRNSLMTFVMIEIINHAMRQINSHHFRKDNKAFIAKCRRLRTIVITCPTGMTEAEQAHLRNAAKYAVEALRRYHEEINSSNSSNNNELDLSGFNISEEDLDPSIISNTVSYADSPFSNIKIVPNGKNIKPLSELKSREDWIYDESSASQINFVYAEIVKKYKENYRKFFDIYGKKLNSKSTSADSLTIASVDIGGGTTDLMICNYTYDKNQHSLHLIPKPLYWETFNLAGDDLVKEVINQVLIDGKKRTKSKYEGIIRNYAKEIGCHDITDKIVFFFGEHGNPQGASHDFYRKCFVHQILFPIAIKFLDQISSTSSMKTELTFDQIFEKTKPNDQLIEYINNHFGNGFNFKSIKWYVSREKINEIIQVKFSERFKQISTLAFACNADFLLLSGKPSALPEIRNIFIRELPLTPDRIINLSNYLIGKWYPFRDTIGKLTDAKTTVAVGAMIYLLAGKYKNLNGFSIDTSKLKQNLISTADIIGPYNATKGSLKSIFLDAESDSYTINEFKPPLTLGFKQLNTDSYPARPIYTLDFNGHGIEDRIKKKNPSFSSIQVQNAARKKLERWRDFKYNIEISRESKKSKEKLSIISVEPIGMEGSSQPNQIDFELRLMTANQPNGYWLDTGEFITLSHQD